MPLSGKALAGLVVAGVLVASHWYAYHTGYTNGDNSVMVKQQADTIAKLSERVAANSALADQYRIQNEQENQNHEKELAAIRTAAARTATQRVPIDAARVCVTAGSPETTTAGSAGSADPGTTVLQQAFADDLRQLAEQADEVTAAYRTLRVRAAACFE